MNVQHACEIIFKHSPSLGQYCQTTLGINFFDSHCSPEVDGASRSEKASAWSHTYIRTHRWTDRPKTSFMPPAVHKTGGGGIIISLLSLSAAVSLGNQALRMAVPVYRPLRHVSKHRGLQERYDTTQKVMQLGGGALNVG